MAGNKEIVRSFLEQSIAERRTIEELCASGFSAHIGAVETMDLESFKKFQGDFYRSFTENSIELGEIMQEGNLVAFRLVTRSRHTGEFMGMPASGKEIAVPVIGMAKLKEGKIFEWWNSPDRLSWMQQLGFSLKNQP